MKNKFKISRLVDKIVDEYSCTIPIDVEELALAIGLPIERMYFKSSLDGLLVYYNREFRIFLNSKIENEERIRFTIAHEIGHYAIDSHRLNIMTDGCVHSEAEYKSNIEIEQEADYFASCLLMPEKEFVNNCNKPFSIEFIKFLANKSKVSITATLYRYIELDIYPLCIFMIKNGKILWAKKSKDFQYSYKKEIPKQSMADNIIRYGKYYEIPESIDTEAWFYPNYRRKDDDYEDDFIEDEQQMFEYCFNLGNSKLLNIVWLK